MCLVKFQRGFEKQKGAIFGFGTVQDDDTESVMKISSLQDTSILRGAPVHNLGEERSVGMMNHELEIRGKNHFNASSQNLVPVLNKSIDLTSGCFSNYRRFKRPADDIKELKLEWSKKMNDLVKEGLSKQEVAALTQENKKNSKTWPSLKHRLRLDHSAVLRT